MARTSNVDVLDTFRFQIEVDGFVRAGFMEVSTPSVEIKTRDYHEAGRHMAPLKITQSANYSEVVLSRGSSVDGDFLRWVQTVFDRNNMGEQTSTNKDNRRTIKIFHYKRTGQLARTYILYNCIPTEFKPISDLNAMNDSLSMETLKLAYERFAVTDANGATVLGNALNQIIGSNLF